ncbi:MAG: hypothetical protein K6B70_04030 [Clostridia bacterium]|nr:hypothetical protein [Clostridia bacterium]
MKFFGSLFYSYYFSVAVEITTTIVIADVTTTVVVNAKKADQKFLT